MEKTKSLLLFLLCFSVSCLNGFGILKLWQHFGNPTEAIHLSLIPLFIMESLLLSLTAVCLTAFFKGGFSKLKRYDDEEGLIFGLVLGFVVGLIVGSIIGLAIEFMSGLIVGFISGLVGGLVGGLIVGLTGELVL